MKRLPVLRLVIILCTVYLASLTYASVKISQLTVLAQANTPTPAPVLFGSDSYGFFIKDKTSGKVRLRIDPNGNLIAPLKTNPQGDNLVPNGGFENDTVGLTTSGPTPTPGPANTPDNWNGNTNAACASCKYQLDNASFNGGGKSEWLSTGNATQDAQTASIGSDPFPVIPGTVYKLSVDLRDDASLKVSAVIRYYSGNATDFSYSVGVDEQTIYSSTLNNSAWATYMTTNGIVTTPTGTDCPSTTICTMARIFISHTGATGNANAHLWVDNIKMTSPAANTSLTAANISSGKFGSAVANGDFEFPGQVGIGTDSPQAALDVASGTVLANNLTANQITLGGSAKSSWPAASQWTGTAPIYYTAGNVGIGTAVPNYTLEVATSDTSNTFPGTSSIKITNRDTGAFGRVKAIVFGYGGAAAASGIASIYDNWSVANGGGDVLAFYTKDATTQSNPTEKVRIDRNGNVGIGTTGPQAKLDVAGTTSTITNTSGDMTMTPAGNLIVSTGNIGIGTNSPAAKLDVGGKAKLLSGRINVGGMYDYDGAQHIINSTTPYTYSTLVTANDLGTNGTIRVKIDGASLNNTDANNARTMTINVVLGGTAICTLPATGQIPASTTFGFIEFDMTLNARNSNSVQKAFCRSKGSNAAGNSIWELAATGSTTIDMTQNQYLNITLSTGNAPVSFAPQMFTLELFPQ